MRMTVLTVEVSGLSGFLCSVTVRSEASVLELQEAIELKSGIPGKQQRLILGLRELQATGSLRGLAKDKGEGCLQLQLVIRPAEQAEWLQELQQVSMDWAAEWLRMQAPRVREDRQVVLAAVAKSGWALQHAAAELRADREVVLAAAVQEGKALGFAAASLRADREVAIVAVGQNGLALQCVSEELRADREVVLAAVAQSGWALNLAPIALKADREVVLAAVAQDGLALQCAAAPLRADQEVMRTAAAQNIFALQFATSGQP